MSMIQSGHFVQITPISGLFRSNIYSIGSILKQHSLITITLQNVNDSSDVKTLLINSIGYMIKGETQKYQLKFGSDLSELQGERTSTYIGTGRQQFAMTGVEPIDINILLQMDDQTLTSACQTDRYISGLCRNEELWRLKINKDYSGAGKYKKLDRTWREYYEILRNIKLNESGTNEAAAGGHLDVLQWMASLGPPVMPGEEDADVAALNGHLNVLQWMALLRPPVRPGAFSATVAVMDGHLDVLQWMAKLQPPILPKVKDANLAVMVGHTDVLQWMAKLQPPILPD
jgi:hypothetical protein